MGQRRGPGRSGRPARLVRGHQLWWRYPSGIASACVPDERPSHQQSTSQVVVWHEVQSTCRPPPMSQPGGFHTPPQRQGCRATACLVVRALGIPPCWRVPRACRPGCRPKRPRDRRRATCSRCPIAAGDCCPTIGSQRPQRPDRACWGTFPAGRSWSLRRWSKSSRTEAGSIPIWWPTSWPWASATFWSSC